MKESQKRERKQKREKEWKSVNKHSTCWCQWWDSRNRCFCQSAAFPPLWMNWGINTFSICPSRLGVTPRVQSAVWCNDESLFYFDAVVHWPTFGAKWGRIFLQLKRRTTFVFIFSQRWFKHYKKITLVLKKGSILQYYPPKWPSFAPQPLHVHRFRLKLSELLFYARDGSSLTFSVQPLELLLELVHEVADRRADGAQVQVSVDADRRPIRGLRRRWQRRQLLPGDAERDVRWGGGKTGRGLRNFFIFAVADAESAMYFNIVAVCLPPSLTNPTFLRFLKAFRGKALGEFLQQLILLMFWNPSTWPQLFLTKMQKYSF